MYSQETYHISTIISKGTSATLLSSKVCNVSCRYAMTHAFSYMTVKGLLVTDIDSNFKYSKRTCDHKDDKNTSVDIH